MNQNLRIKLKTLNINSNVTFTVTLTGAAILNDYYADYVHKPAKVKQGDEHTMQLWKVLSLFGDHTSPGAEPFCEKCEIKIFDKDLT